MTREEKINTLKSIIQECEEYQWQRRETLFEIIKELEQEPCEDAVSREAALALAKDVVFECGCKHRCIDATQIYELPSVTPKQRTGKWLPTSDIEKWGYKCSICGGIDSTDLSNYCGWCGAEMEGESE